MCSSRAVTGRNCRAGMAHQQPSGVGSSTGEKSASGSATGGRHSQHLTIRASLIGRWHFLTAHSRPRKRGRKGGVGEKVGLTKKGKAPVDGGRRRQWSALGIPSRGANRAEVRLAEQTVDTIRVARPRGRPNQWPEQLVADRGYDWSAFRRVLRGRGIRLCIPPKRRPKNWKVKPGRPVVARKDEYRLRCTVECSFAWLGTFRRLLIRWDRHFSVFRSFFACGVGRLCVRRLVCVAPV
jgi:hypothetical protein